MHTAASCSRKPSVAVGKSRLCAEGRARFTPQIFTDSVPSAGPGAKTLGSGPGCVHYSRLTRAGKQTLDTGRGSRRRQEPGSPHVGDGTHRRTVAATHRSLPQPTLPLGIWLLPRSLRPALRGETGKLGAGRGPPRLPGWGWEQSLWSLWFTFSRPPRAGAPPGPGWVR